MNVELIIKIKYYTTIGTIDDIKDYSEPNTRGKKSLDIDATK